MSNNSSSVGVNLQVDGGVTNNGLPVASNTSNSCSAGNPGIPGGVTPNSNIVIVMSINMSALGNCLNNQGGGTCNCGISASNNLIAVGNPIMVIVEGGGGTVNVGIPLSMSNNLTAPGNEVVLPFVVNDTAGVPIGNSSSAGANLGPAVLSDVSDIVLIIGGDHCSVSSGVVTDVGNNGPPLSGAMSDSDCNLCWADDIVAVDIGAGIVLTADTGVHEWQISLQLLEAQALLISSMSSEVGEIAGNAAPCSSQVLLMNAMTQSMPDGNAQANVGSGPGGLLQIAIPMLVNVAMGAMAQACVADDVTDEFIFYFGNAIMVVISSVIVVPNGSVAFDTTAVTSDNDSVGAIALQSVGSMVAIEGGVGDLHIAVSIS